MGEWEANVGVQVMFRKHSSGAEEWNCEWGKGENLCTIMRRLGCLCVVSIEGLNGLECSLRIRYNDAAFAMLMLGSTLWWSKVMQVHGMLLCSIVTFSHSDNHTFTIKIRRLFHASTNDNLQDLRSYSTPCAISTLNPRSYEHLNF